MTEPRNITADGQQPIPGIGEGDVGAVYPTQEVSDGQVHGYVGNVQTYDPAPHGHTNVAPPPATAAAVGAARLAGQAREARIAPAVGSVAHADTGDQSPPTAVVADRPIMQAPGAETAASRAAAKTRDRARR